MKQTNNFTRRTTAMLAILVTMLMSGAAAFAQTTAFTYQGRFTDTTVAQPTSGNYTMTFRLFDAETGGNQVPNNSTVLTSMVSVAGGIFTTRLDFGAAAFNTTNQRYLEIQVGSTVLTPRQEITSTPFANRAVNAAAADALSANCVGCVTNVQINSLDGTKVTGSVANATAAQNAEQLGGVAANGFVQSGTSAFVRNQTTAQTADFNITGTGSIGGNVGIGTQATATEALRVVGSNGTGNTNGTGGAGEGISLQAGSGNTSSAGGAGASVSLLSGNGGDSSNGGIFGGRGANITLQVAGGGSSFSNSGGSGASISLQAGNGGGGPIGGGGGSITLQPGGGGINGNVLLAPGSGNVGIGTTSPTSKLYVNGDLTVTGTINGTVNTTNFIRNQTAQQTGNFNISGSGAVGSDLTVGGSLNVGGTLNASLGQEATTVFGTNSLTVGRTMVISYTLVPGLRQTINVPEITDLFISTDGGIRTLSTTSDGVSIVDVAILLDGDIVTQRRYFIENDRFGETNVNWALSIARLVLSGSHTIEVRARSLTTDGLSNATVSSGSGDFMQGKLTVLTIKK